MEQQPLWTDTVYLVSCCSQKAAPVCNDHSGAWEGKVFPKFAAKDLYVSDWFKKAKAFIEATGCAWHILSALHGLTWIELQLEPYDFSFSSADPNDRCRRQTWSKIAASNLRRLHRPGQTRVVIFAGHTYREFLLPALASEGFQNVEVPMAHMGIGQQKRWLMQNQRKTQHNGSHEVIF